jgi:hypothetical protein
MGLKLEVFKVEGKLYWVAPYPGWNLHLYGVELHGSQRDFSTPLALILLFNGAVYE